ncbi:MAG: hypothetical protein KDN18_23240 [Verrucomicrobiae bacterium]|nr:hypothetical protein [Verrucomicrobiae bacterium]
MSTKRHLPIFLVALTAAANLQAGSPIEVARTNENTLNDLIREVPAISPSWEQQLRKLSSIQEQLYLHERKMRGEGMPLEMAAMFSSNYSAILAALIEDRITEQYGRELLSVHRQLVDHTREWLEKRVRDESYPGKLAENIDYFRSELDRYSIPLAEVPDQLRTPVINGYQAWVGELLAWGEAYGKLAPGEISRIRTKAADLERFERSYKQDGVLKDFERELLHGRFVKLARETVETIAR